MEMGPESRLKHRSVILIRLAVGLIFFTQGLLKYLDPHMGVIRFTRIGFPFPSFTAHLVGTFEMACGLLVLIGLFTRLASIPLLIVILTAIATTKIPELWRADQGFWFMVSDARTDFAMTMCLLFLVSFGGGTWSLDTKLREEQPRITDHPATETTVERVRRLPSAIVSALHVRFDKL